MGNVSLFPPKPFLPSPVTVSENDLRVEQELLGSLLMQPVRAIPKLPCSFSSEHYGDDLHRNIHEAVVELGAGATALTVGAALGADSATTKYLVDLMVGGTSWLAVEGCAASVTEAHTRRQLAHVMNDLRQGLESGSAESPATGLIHIAMARLDALLGNASDFQAGGVMDEATADVLGLADQAFRGEMPSGRSTGMPSVDEAMGGLVDGTFNVLGARPGQGKTAIAVQWAVNVAKACQASGEKAGVLGVSLEMGRIALARRVLSHASGVPVSDIKRGRVEGRMERLVRVRKDLLGLPFFIEDAGGQSLIAIRQKARAARRRFGRLALIWVDHINIVKPDEADRRNGGTQSVGRISNGLRDLSKEFECPVLCLAQLSRGLLSRDDKRPNLGDLRQSGDIEQDADTVMFIHREEAYLPKTEPGRAATETTEKWQARIREWDAAKIRCAGKAELIFEKVRDGTPCTVQLNFDGPTTSFSEPGAPRDNPRTPQFSFAGVPEEPEGFMVP